MAIILTIVVFIFALAFYFLPTFVAKQNKKEDVLAIFILNLVLGWTIIGWIVSLVWSFTKNNK